MVGNGATIGANVALHALAAGELLALCSDGVHKHLASADWRRRAGAPMRRWPARPRRWSRSRARSGSVDDATVLLMRAQRAGRDRRAATCRDGAAIPEEERR